MQHTEAHPLAGKTVKLKIKVPEKEQFASSPGVQELLDQEYRVEDYWDRVGGGSWMDANGNPACMKYARRSDVSGLPTDDEVVYGKVGAFGHLVHVSELGDVIDD